MRRSAAEIKKYFEEHKVAEGLSLAVNKAANLKVTNTLQFIGEELIKMSSEEKPLKSIGADRDDGGTSGGDGGLGQ